MRSQVKTVRFVTPKASSTSDSRAGYACGTATSDNLAAVMRNNVVIFENALSVSDHEVDGPAVVKPHKGRE